MTCWKDMFLNQNKMEDSVQLQINVWTRFHNNVKKWSLLVFWDQFVKNNPMKMKIHKLRHPKIFHILSNFGFGSSKTVGVIQRRVWALFFVSPGIRLLMFVVSFFAICSDFLLFDFRLLRALVLDWSAMIYISIYCDWFRIIRCVIPPFLWMAV